uniref:Gamma-butyrobetaine dioxygenase n=1 Tax=Ganoderma boninense TaxID=34458 RepID=A0A5K1K825_9APHY|nr:Gamma-butyrobetaine dioxygenase [Ganoderma boninense]
MDAAYNTIWKERKPFVRNEGGVDVLIDELSALAYQPVVMVRNEYTRTFQHIQTATYASIPTHWGLVLTGQPGIGKTLFLYYVLGAALAAHMPVVFCERSDYCLLFDDRGVHIVTDLGGYPYFPHRTLFLVDSNDDLRSPPASFTHHILGGFIVQATPPDLPRWKQWAKEVGAMSWVMGLWEREELLALQRTREALRQAPWANPPPGTTVYTPVELLELLGPCPRTCMREAGRTKSQDGPQADFAAYLNLPALSSDLEGVLHMVYYGGTPPNAYASSHLDRIFFLTNAWTPNPGYCVNFHFSVPTLFLCRMLSAALRACPRAAQRRIAETCAPSHAIAAPLYLPLALDLLLGARTAHTCHLVDRESPTNSKSSLASFHIEPSLSVRPASLPLPVFSGSGSSSNTNTEADAPPTPHWAHEPASVADNTVLFAPPPPCSASSGPPTAFHALVVSEGGTRATLLRMAALADTPNLHAHVCDVWPRRADDIARDRACLRAVVHAFARGSQREGEGEKEVRVTLVYVALRRGAAERAARSADARAILDDPELRARNVAVGWLELRGDHKDKDKDKVGKRLLNAIEKEKEKIRVDWERRRARNTRDAERALAGLKNGSGNADATAGSGTRERGIFERGWRASSSRLTRIASFHV